MFSRLHLKSDLLRNTHCRKLHVESLEDRRMLATMVVTNLDDGPIGTGDGELSLREAVLSINIGAPFDGIGPSSGTFGVNDTILFDASLFAGGAGSLALDSGELILARSVTIAGPASSSLTIDAEQNSRIFDIPEGTADITLSQMTLIGGLTTAQDERGGAIRSQTTGELLLNKVTVTDSATTGDFSTGGAVSATGLVTLFDSTIVGNRTEGTSGNGGGIFSMGEIHFTRSTVADNSTAGQFASGGGVSSDADIVSRNSTFSGNSALGPASSGGGILAVGDVQLTESTVSGNETNGVTSSGGGISAEGTISVIRSTVFRNQALGNNATGGGLHTATGAILVSGSIIANNGAGGGDGDIESGTGDLTVEYSLVSTAFTLNISPATNLLNLDPQLGPLSGGGTTKTHAPLPGSPIIDAGNPSIVGAPSTDQRGASFSRIASGDGSGAAVIDMGSHELQAPALADFDSDGDVDGADFLDWQRNVGTTAAAVRSDGNADDDTDVDNHDLAVWVVQFGDVGLPTLAASQELSTSSSSQSALVDLAIAVELGSVVSDSADFVDLGNEVKELAAGSRQLAFASLGSSNAPSVEVLSSLANPSEQRDALSVDLAIGEEGIGTSI